MSVRQLTITLVTELAGPPDEGMRVWIKHYREAMSDAGHTVVDVVATGSPRWGAADPRLLRTLRSHDPDLIQYVPYSGLTAASLVRLRMLGLGAPAAMRSIAVLQSGRDGIAAPPGLAADVAYFASARLSAATGRIAGTSSVVYPIVDTARFRPRGENRAAARRRLGLPADRPVVLHVGHLKPSRNLGVLSTLAAKGDLSVLMVASTSTEPDQELRSRLEASGVRVIREYLPDIERVYWAADVYAFPVEDLLGAIEVPLSVIEARSAGLPVVTTAYGGLPELFGRDRGVTFAEPARFADAIASVLRKAGPAPPVPATLERFSRERFVAAIEDGLSGHRGGAPGRMIVLSGVDGAGKSTQIELLVHDLEARGLVVGTLWCRWDPLLAKPAVRLLGLASRLRRRKTARGDATGPSPSTAERRRSIRARILRNRWAGVAWRGMLIIDYGARLAPAVRRARRRNDVVLLDRYWQDVMVDLSYGGRLEDPPRLLRRLLPEPAGVVILDVPEAIALERKTDTPDLEYLSERRRLYAEVAERSGAAIVDARPAADLVFAELSVEVQRILQEDRAPRQDSETAACLAVR